MQNTENTQMFSKKHLKNGLKIHLLFLPLQNPKQLLNVSIF